MNNKLMLVVATLMGTSLLVACNHTSPEPDATNILGIAMEPIKVSSTYEVNKTINIEIESVEDDKTNMSITTHTRKDMQPEPVYEIDTKLSLTMGEETQESDVKQYLIKDDKMYQLYTQANDRWERAMLVGEATNALTQQLHWQDIQKAVLVGSEKVEDLNEEDIKCYEIKMPADDKAINIIKEQLRDLEIIGIDPKELDEMMSELGSEEPIEIYFYVDKETGVLIGEKCDLSEGLRKQIIEAEGIGEEEVDQFKCTLDVIYRVDEEEEAIIIPEEIRQHNKK